MYSINLLKNVAPGEKEHLFAKIACCCFWY